MSFHAIHAYHNAVHKIYQFSGQNHEQAIKEEFKRLLNAYCEKRHLLVVSEIPIKNKRGELIRPDGIVKNSLRLDCGYWESKANVDLEKEVDHKINAGYPLINTLFQDDKQAILYQNEVFSLKTSLTNEQELDRLLTQFIHYESKEITEFHLAIEAFKKDVPHILMVLKNMIHHQEECNAQFVQVREGFLAICKKCIHSDISISDVNEMLLQHILTEEIFTSVFNDSQFHRENNIAKELYTLENTFFSGKTKRDTLNDIKHYYDTIKRRASAIYHHKDKQIFLKSVYENFYKVYNPKAADRQGIVYTPEEIVRFQVESVDTLLQKYFGKSLSDEGITILDPCTGTGTYICDVIDYLPPHRLRYKYKHDLFANELGLLPYYIANLNIEYTYQQKMGGYEEFNHICWVDTLDMTNFMDSPYPEQKTLSDGISKENTERIKKENEQKIAVIIGNPPYNAKQENYNQQNANRSYKEIDYKIKNTYIKRGTAQNQIVVYDMYVRFYRWASDRIKQGVIGFITNNSFINSRAFDGFRQCIKEEFDFAYIIDLKGDMRGNYGKNVKISNVFDIQTGVSLLFLIKRGSKSKEPCKIKYMHLLDEMSKEDKLHWLTVNKIEKIDFDVIIPDEKNNWINQTDNDFDTLLPLIDKEVKSGKSQKAIFTLFSLGIATHRDDWVYDFDKNTLEDKMKFFVEMYQNTLKNPSFKGRYLIRFDRELDKYCERKIEKYFEEKKIVKAIYRPFTKLFLYFDKHFNAMTYQWSSIFNKENKIISIPGLASSKDFHCISISETIDLNALPAGSQNLPLYVYDKEGYPHDNITDWAWNQFKNRYQMELTKLDLFHYVYAVLHNPHYRKKYELNLKRDFPRIPFYTDFFQWAEYGKQLMNYHLRYETVEPYPLVRHESTAVKIPKAKLKADKVHGVIILDDNTTLSGVPAEAWEYKLGHRSALEWICDQYKEKKPKDPTIAERFNTYRFADYKEQVVDLLMRVCTVSVETVKMVKELSLLG